MDSRALVDIGQRLRALELDGRRQRRYQENLERRLARLYVVPDAPTLTYGVPAGTQAAQFELSLDWSEDVTGFALADLTVTSGTASNFAGSGAAYTVDIAPAADTEGTVTVAVAADAVMDSDDMGNIASSQDVPIDTLAPAIVSAVTNSAGTQITVTFHEPLADTVISSEVFSLTVAGLSRRVTDVAVQAATSTLTFDIVGAAIGSGDTLTLDYTKP